MTILVRAFAPDDWQVLRDVRLAALLDAPYAFYSTYEQTVGRAEQEWRAWPSRGRGFLAWLAGEPVGMVAIVPTVVDPTRADLVAMWVAPAARGTGVADALMTSALDWARVHGCATVDLDVAPGNQRAERLYARHGFLPVGESPHLPNGLTMRHTLPLP